jgi:hypothetical protein
MLVGSGTFISPGVMSTVPESVDWPLRFSGLPFGSRKNVWPDPVLRLTLNVLPAGVPLGAVTSRRTSKALVVGTRTPIALNVPSPLM